MIYDCNVLSCLDLCTTEEDSKRDIGGTEGRDRQDDTTIGCAAACSTQGRLIHLKCHIT